MNTRTLVAVVGGLGAACTLASACILVEDFEGYRPLRPEEAQCGASPCLDAGFGGGSVGTSSGSVGDGGAGGSACVGSSCMGAGGGGGGCAAIDCGGGASPCQPITVMTGLTSFLRSTDPSAYLLADLGISAHIQRIAKKGCNIPALDVPAPFPQNVVSDGVTMAWISSDLGSACGTVALQTCSTASCSRRASRCSRCGPSRGR